MGQASVAEVNDIPERIIQRDKLRVCLTEHFHEHAGQTISKEEHAGDPARIKQGATAYYQPPDNETKDYAFQTRLVQLTGVARADQQPRVRAIRARKFDAPRHGCGASPKFWANKIRNATEKQSDGGGNSDGVCNGP